ncbi:MAG: energy-coupling factor transporter transmembrane protein EcfT [Chloroflexi bacterium]|nr:energy-coupling factor transporter transmembrane protein EcfT [Chloroflexota bacterium]
MPSSINVINFMANVDGDSWVHRLDARTKVVVLLFFSIIPLFFNDWRFILVYVVLSLPLWLTAKIKLRPMLGPLTGVGFFLLLTFILIAVKGPSALTDETPSSAFTWCLQMGPIVVTSHNFTRGIFLAARLAVPMTIGLLMMATTDPTYMGKGLKKLRMPTTVVFMILAGLRFIPIVTEQLFNILDAMTIRGVSHSRIERTKLLILPLFITSLRRTRTMGLACEARGFGANRWNEFYQDFQLRRVDKAIMVAVVVLTVVSLVVRFGLGLGVMAGDFVR